MNDVSLPKQHQELLNEVYQRTKDALEQGAPLVLALEGDLFGAGTSMLIQALQIKAQKEGIHCKCLDFGIPCRCLDFERKLPCPALPQNADDVRNIPSDIQILLIDHAPWARPLHKRQEIIGDRLAYWLVETKGVLIYGTLREWQPHKAQPSGWPTPDENIMVPLLTPKEKVLEPLPPTQRMIIEKIIEKQDLKLPWALLQVYQKLRQSEDSPEGAWGKAVAHYLCRGAGWDPPLYSSLSQRLEEIARDLGNTSDLHFLFSKLKERLFFILDWPAFWLAPAKETDLQRPLHPTIAFLLADWLTHKGGAPCQDN